MKNLAPLKRYGQNFLVDQNVSKKIIESAMIEEDDFVIEIGPGKGALTTYLLRIPNDYLGIEVDRGLFELLSEDYEKDLTLANKNILLSDALRTDFGFIDKRVNVIANLPYNIASLIIVKMIKENIRLKGMTLMIQKEMAQRLFAPPGIKDYGRLSVLIQNLFDGRVLFEVSEGCFYPKPKVKSVVIKLTPKNDFYEKKPYCEDFENFLRRIFSQPRKILKNVLSEEYIRVFSEIYSDLLQKRPGQIDPETYWEIFRFHRS
ncbi:16S rRNA (adenine(1518)-N(6)/adenine(1519)-N(6))-dimethyltransferase RsmA [Thermodesulfobium sp. 4217-1]|uniref:16S rRNA (adenine(1518)-N(6)/adenine(1519)-N(6))- dimethyltransferase RsmA n=1 Tax=Thermodesulfobium sp. 4217-1 TaxID=3120013 RepID=UPI003221548E